MKKLIALLLLILVAAVGYYYAQDEPKGLNVRYDKFENRTDVDTDKARLSAGYQPFLASAGVFYDGEGKPKAPPSHVFVTFTVSTKRWIFLHSRTVIFLADGERIDLGDGARSSVIGRVLRESLTRGMPLETFKRIANAKTVEVKAGYLTSEIPEKTLANWRALIEYVESP